MPYYSYFIYSLFLLFPLIVFLCAIFDLYSYTIPNELSIALIVLFYIFAFLNPNITYEMVLYNSLAGICGFILCFFAFCAGLFGGGDAKLLSVVFLWLGPYDMLPFMYYISIAGGFLALMIIIIRAQACYPIFLKIKMLSSLYFGPAREDGSGKNILPYGIAIAAATFIYLPKSNIFQMV